MQRTSLKWIFAIIFGLQSFAALAGEPLAIRGAARIGVKTDRPFLYLVPATGQAPLEFQAAGLPAGLSLDSKTGIITGSSVNEGKFNVTLTVRDATGTTSRQVEFVVARDAIALTPVMAWNPWYVWGCAIDDGKIRQAADLLVSTGLAAHGYNYINLDDCWAGQRDANGVMQPNSKFPDMKALADYVHAKGLKIGIYTSPGTKTCAGYAGTEDHNFDEGGKSYLETDVATYAAWGMDLVKYDWCIFPREASVKAKYLAKQSQIYKRMTDALDRSPRAIVNLICQYGENDVWKWAPSVGGSSWRTDNDLADDWRAILRSMGRLDLATYQSPGHFNDLDMLMVGKANWPEWNKYQIPNAPPRPTKLTIDEQRTHMSFWAMMASPLIFSGDLAQVDAVAFSMLANDDVLSVNQDPDAKPALPLVRNQKTLVIKRALSDGSTAVAMFNLDSQPQTIEVMYDKLGLPPRGPLTIRNLWSHVEIESDKMGMRATVPAHGVFFSKLTLK